MNSALKKVKTIYRSRILPRYGNGPGDLEAYFERLYKYPGYIGGFVWEWCDHSVYMGKTIEGKDKFFYGGDWNEEIHDGNFCMDGLVYPDRTPHTGLLEHKNVARPIRAILLDASKGLVELDNKLDYTNIKDGLQSLTMYKKTV